MERQKGNIFEYSTLLCSFLIGSGYDAYVASGYASREFCFFDQTMITCPVLPDFSKKEEEVKDEGIPKYIVKAPLDLRSKFLLEMDEKEEQKIRDKIKAKEEEERLAIEEFEKPAPDELFGTRIHSWVVVLPCKDIEEPFFIDPLTGNKYDLSHPSYLGLESLWNHTNYWVNLQDCKEGCKNLKFDLTDLECWEHLLAGEPWFYRKVDIGEEDEITPDIILMEKHLDMPTSWVQKLDISNSGYENRFPAGAKSVLYKKTKLEQFAPYVQEDGLVTRITTYDDYDRLEPLWVYEYYSNRVDCLTEIRRNVLEKSILELFRRGREDCLKEHFYYENGVGVEDERTLQFFHMARHDGLEKLEMHPLFLIEHFRDRQDFLYYRKVEYEPRGLAAEEGPKRIVLKLVEQFNRDSEKEVDEDIARRTFAVADNQILLKFHYAPNNVTAATREFIKPKLSEMGDRLTFNPDLTAGYQTDPTDKPPKKSYLFKLLEEQLKAEEESLLLVRKMEDDLAILLQLRATEWMQPQLDVSIYNMERNTLAIAGMKEIDKIMRAAEDAKKGDVELDYLAPYFARIGNPESVSLEEALKIREDCIRDFKQLLVDRINKTQKAFEELATKMVELNSWFEEEQDNLTPAQEVDYIKKTEKLAFDMRVLEIRMVRFRDLSTFRYMALESLIKTHRKLQLLNYQH
ncbi:Dynein regulatory complex subunit 7 [Blattella germanica]|nr:Dynein regulatory complex subunit 7 [Blattella germanica]